MFSTKLLILLTYLNVDFHNNCIVSFDEMKNPNGKIKNTYQKSKISQHCFYINQHWFS